MHISFTPSTLPMLLLAMCLWYHAKGQLFPVAMFMSVFQAASIVNLSLGGLLIGVQPTYVVLLLVLISRLTQQRLGEIATGLPTTSTTLLLAAFVAYAAVSAVVHPFLFQGVLVSNPKLGIGVPLQWELGHLNQLFYLLLSFAIYLIAAYWTTPAELTKSLNWFAGGVVLASLMGLYQYLASNTGLPYPREVLDTNPTYGIFRAYEIDGFPRMNSTFIEAAAAAFSMTVALAIVLWRFLARTDSLRNISQVLIIGIGLLLTISTTGYVCMVFLVLFSVSRYFTPWHGSANARSLRLFLALPVFAVFVAAIGVPSVRESVVRLGHTVLLDKTTTDSYRARTALNESAFKTAADTHWLGAGWGVCRASSFIPTILGNVGIPGSLLFSVFCWRIMSPLVRWHRPKVQTHGAVLFGLSVVLLDLTVSAPELAHPIIWLLFAVAAKFAAGRAPMLAKPRQSYLLEGSMHATA
jgi:hypothetical protein